MKDLKPQLFLCRVKGSVKLRIQMMLSTEGIRNKTNLLFKKFRNLRRRVRGQLKAVRYGSIFLSRGVTFSMSV